MYDEQTIERLANDILLTKLQEHLHTYDVEPTERLKRSIALTVFWVAEGEKFNKLRKTVKQDDKVVMEHLRPYYAYWYKLKLICEGEEISKENLSKLDIKEVFEFKDSVLGVEPDCD